MQRMAFDSKFSLTKFFLFPFGTLVQASSFALQYPNNRGRGRIRQEEGGGISGLPLQRRYISLGFQYYGERISRRLPSMSSLRSLS